MGCDLGFDNHNEDERTLPRKNLYDSILKLGERLREDAKNPRGHFEGVNVVINIPLNRPFEIRDVECKGWYQSSGSGSMLVGACSSCRYRTR